MRVRIPTRIPRGGEEEVRFKILVGLQLPQAIYARIDSSHSRFSLVHKIDPFILYKWENGDSRQFSENNKIV